MTVQSVIREVTAFVGVRPPQGSVFLSPYVDRTAWEFVQLANEIAQRIAYETRDWTFLHATGRLDGAAGIPETNPDLDQTSFPLPENYKRLLLNSEFWNSASSQCPLKFIPDYNEWLASRLSGANTGWGEWMIVGNFVYISPKVPPEAKIYFPYLHKNCIRLNSGGYGDEFLNDADTFMISERLLKLGMIWQWKCNKGATYAEDLANYEDALAKVAGADKPSPIIIG